MRDINQGSDLLLTLASEEGRLNPYPVYDELRKLPLLYDEHHRGYLVTRYADCKAALSGKEFGRPASEFFDGRIPEWRQHPGIVCGTRMMQFGDEESHPRRRGAVGGYFTPRRVRDLVAKEMSDVDRMLDHLATALTRDGLADIQEEISFRLPIVTIAAMFGLPEEDVAHFRPLVMAMVAGLEPDLSTAQLTACDEAYQQLRRYFQEVIDDRRRSPRDDLASHIASCRYAQNSGLLEDEAMAMFISLFAAGTMNTSSFIGNGVAALLQHPDQAELLRCEDGSAEDAVTEILRYDAPMQVTRRMTVVDTHLGGTFLPKGTHLAVALGAANRDPAAYNSPNKFLIKRAGPPPLSLGGGRFYCIGAALGKQEGALVFRKLLKRFPTLDLAGPPTPNLRAVLRGYLAIPVSTETPHKVDGDR
ncbi:cytochrome P450 [Streptomyces sp. TX20-6-3]|uniref:cytochrome P450 n=1 Tax=Streptomyces sp. TX20-6-3 TaxID=3028705 RepID=UPI0029B9C1C6|nr:cytochrome P450 [Streptomyces sp. TX20-6-3]MDX2565285.1 cytochrome P450 [Streptomyces sp. TX20-6-3]